MNESIPVPRSRAIAGVHLGVHQQAPPSSPPRRDHHRDRLRRPRDHRNDRVPGHDRGDIRIRHVGDNRSGRTFDRERVYEGLEGTQIVIGGGLIDATSEDDGLNVAGDGGTTATAGGTTATARGPGGRGGGMDVPVDGWFVTMTGGTLLIDAVPGVVQ